MELAPRGATRRGWKPIVVRRCVRPRRRLSRWTESGALNRLSRSSRVEMRKESFAKRRCGVMSPRALSSGAATVISRTLYSVPKVPLGSHSCLAHSGSLWLTLAHSGSLWLTLASYHSRPTKKYLTLIPRQELEKGNEKRSTPALVDLTGPPLLSRQIRGI